ncbi:protein phosphatase 2C domain-containing protein [Streptomyces roseirectus]|uniref:Protein phosphatase 2C domain-containing protein n=1 Tax=Streptomyces roseirectus TaxID=2768066 RepID=A0A7H0I9F8_9ACTN|nr:PP2C family serine/threonine-protein phosphatase [Streptomyces roseirectus]QNP69424.1 protein phosphatase 2C domain-containing protein [Streptomyces roseirectus]
MSQQGGSPIGHQDDWWGQLYDDTADDTGPTTTPDSLDDRFASASGTVNPGTATVPGPRDPSGPLTPADHGDEVTGDAGYKAAGDADIEPIAGKPASPARKAYPRTPSPTEDDHPAEDARAEDARITPPQADAGPGADVRDTPPRADAGPEEPDDTVHLTPVRRTPPATPQPTSPPPAPSGPAASARPTPPASAPPEPTPSAPPHPSASPRPAPPEQAPPRPGTSPRPVPPHPAGPPQPVPSQPSPPEPAASPRPAPPESAPPRPVTPPRPAASPGPAAPRPVAAPEPAAPRPVAAPKPAAPRPATEPKLAAPRPVTPPEPASPRPATEPAPASPPPPSPRAPWEPPPETPTGPTTFPPGPLPPGFAERPEPPAPETEAPAAAPPPRPALKEYVGSGPPTYDANPTALPLADPDALDDLVADTVLDGARYGSGTVRAVSLRGDSARYRGEPRRDALLTARFGYGDQALVLIAMATGARATVGAHRAAAEVCRWIGRAVGRSHVRLAEDIRAGRRGDLKSGLHRLTDRSLGRLRAGAAEQGLAPQEYTATLRCLLLPADPECRTRVFFGVGDGGLFRLRGGEWQDIEPAAGEPASDPERPLPGAAAGPYAQDPASGPYPPESTTPYDQLPPPDPFRFRTSLARPGDTLLMCTSGLADPLRGELEFAGHLTARWSGAPAPGLAEFLADVQIRVKGYADDRTAAAVWET